MRRFQRVERALLLACASSLAADALLRPRVSLATWRAVEAALALAVVVLLVLHRRRQEMLPLYVAVLAGIAVRAAPSLSGAVVSIFGHDCSCASALHAASVAGVALAWAASLLFPWPDFSQLHGAFQTIGCRSARLGGVECRIFYPSARSAAPLSCVERLSYLHHGNHLMRGMSIFTRLPAWIFNNMRNAFLSAVEDAPVATPPDGAAGWPVAIFSHGLGGSLEMYSHVNQQLASSGHLVVVVNHCDGSASVASPKRGTIQYYHQISQEVRDNINGAGFRFRNAQLKQRIREVRAVLDEVERETQAGHGAFEQADMSSVSVIGHSFGGATALSVAHVDERVKRAVLLDAWMEPLDESVRDGVGARVPVLHLMSEHFLNWRPNLDSMKQHAKGCTHDETLLTVLLGSRHNNFSDIPIFAPAVNRWMKSAGRIDPLYALQAIGQLSAAFLKGTFVSRVAQFPEVQVVH